MKNLASFGFVVLLTLLLWAIGGCTRVETEGAAGEHTLTMVMSLKNVVPGREGTTKTTTTITQSDGLFRGIEKLYVIPFTTDNEKVEPQESRLGHQNVVFSSTGINKTALVPNNNSFLFGSAVVPNGMNRVLTYGNAPDEGDSSSKDGKHLNGVLSPEGIDNPDTSDDISFHLEPILTVAELSEAEATAEGLLDQLNVVMSLMGNSQNASIINIYDGVKRENQILACSYSTFNQLRTEIQSALWRIPYESNELLQEIRQIQEAISEFSSVLTAAGGTFPSQYGIPEGSIGFWWDGKRFVKLINGVNISLVDPATYCYPPSLWYYANSSIKTSINENVRNLYVETNEYWEDILVNYTDGQSVNSFTQSVAIVDQLEYGVGLMELSLTAPGAEAASLINGCPLTGIIIGDQRDVDFRFVPGQGPGRYIYDNVVSGLSIGNTDSFVQTLVLQTGEGEFGDVHFALEFRNNTGITRRCQQGDILPWCKFYLAGVLKPSDGRTPQSSSETFNSVFTKDHKTTISVKVDGLRSAYNTVPDLRSPQLEIGVVAEMKWSQLTPQSIILDF